MDLSAFFVNIFSGCVDWFNSIFTATGMSDWLLAAIGIIAAIRFFIMPLFGGGAGASSDKASKRSKRDNKDKE